MKFLFSLFVFLFLSTSFFAQYDESFSQISMLYSDFSVQSKQFLDNKYIDKNEAKKLNKILVSINSAEAKFFNPKNGLTDENKAILVYLDSKQNEIDSIASCFHKTIIDLTICDKASNINIPIIMHLDFLKQEAYGFDLIDKYSNLIKTLSAVMQDKIITDTEMIEVISLIDKINNVKTSMRDNFSDKNLNFKLFEFFDSQVVLIDSLTFQLCDLSFTYNYILSISENKIPNDFYFNYRYPVYDAGKMMIMVENYTELAKKVSEDNKLSDKEIEDIKIFDKELTDFENEMDEKYKNDKEGYARVNKYFEDNKTETDKIYEDFYYAMVALYSCVGAEVLD